ncbi:hypothetical protein NKI80_00035 [Mesorhizobium sp. M0387]|uniref:hypothetical protein n=1 Tax=Mesorhizobium sp. M0387 TaxID=2956940 RepID=UPI0033387324
MAISIISNSAQASECAEQIAASDNVPKAMLSCLQAVEKENNQLRDQVNDLLAGHSGGGGTLPPGVIVAFDSTAGCPAGWTDVGTNESERFAGRTIIGAGPRVDRGSNQTTLRRVFDEQGGSEQHVLALTELPAHSFKVLVNSVTFSKVDKYDAGGKDYRAVGSNSIEATTNTVGGSAAFSTVSPFIVLYFCRKD